MATTVVALGINGSNGKAYSRATRNNMSSVAGGYAALSPPPKTPTGLTNPPARSTHIPC